MGPHAAFTGRSSAELIWPARHFLTSVINQKCRRQAANGQRLEDRILVAALEREVADPVGVVEGLQLHEAGAVDREGQTGNACLPLKNWLAAVERRYLLPDTAGTTSPTDQA